MAEDRPTPAMAEDRPTPAMAEDRPTPAMAEDRPTFDGEIADWVEARGVDPPAAEGEGHAFQATPPMYTTQGGYSAAPEEDGRFLLEKAAPPSLLLGKLARLAAGGYPEADEADSGKPVAHSIVAVGLGADEWGDGEFDRSGTAKTVYVAACGLDRADAVLALVYRELRSGRVKAGEVRDARGSGRGVRATLWSSAPPDAELLSALEEVSAGAVAASAKN